MLPLAPARLSMTMVWPHFFCSASPTMRAWISTPPPGEKPRMKRTGLSGYSACAAVAPSTSPAASSQQRIQQLTSSSLNQLQPIGARRGPREQRRPLVDRCARGDPLERVPDHPIAADVLVRRKVALEHTPIDPESLDAGLEIAAPRLRQLER